MVSGGFALVFIAGHSTLRAATVGGATLLGRADLGRLTPGVPADVVALDADPRRDLSTLLRPVWVI